ncbi:MAG: hypothetical protein ABR498_01545 [Candidatus Dormibacteria bacterium]
MARRRPHIDPGGVRRLLLSDDAAAVTPFPTARRPTYDAALAADPTDGGADEDRTTLEALAGARIAQIGEVLYGSNAVFLVEFDADDPEMPDTRMRAIYKPARGERPLWDFPRRTLFLREAATFLVDAALGFGRVPPTVVRDGPLGPGSMQLFVHAIERRFRDLDTTALERQLREIAALDVLVNNADRKRAHLLVTRNGRIRAIDNALTFLPYPRQRTALIDLGGSELPEQTAAAVRALNAPAERQLLIARLERLLAPYEVDAFRHRLDELASDPVYPVLDDWDGRPFEWW